MYDSDFCESEMQKDLCYEFPALAFLFLLFFPQKTHSELLTLKNKEIENEIKEFIKTSKICFDDHCVITRYIEKYPNIWIIDTEIVIKNKVEILPYLAFFVGIVASSEVLSVSYSPEFEEYIPKDDEHNIPDITNKPFLPEEHSPKPETPEIDNVFDLEFILSDEMQTYLDWFDDVEMWFEEIIIEGPDKIIHVQESYRDGTFGVLAWTNVGGTKQFYDKDDIERVAKNGSLDELIKHETLHNLGLRHNDDRDSLMYPYLINNQKLTPDILKDLEEHHYYT